MWVTTKMIVEEIKKNQENFIEKRNYEDLERISNNCKATFKGYGDLIWI